MPRKRSGVPARRIYREVPVGAIFGSLTVVGPGDRPYHWSCLCECGQRRDVTCYDLVPGKPHACRCSPEKRQRSDRYPATSVGSRYGNLTVTGTVIDADGRALWSCVCACGARRDIPRRELVRGLKLCEGCPFQWEKNFWDRVNKTSECWEWTGYRGLTGYGSFRWNNAHHVVHRISWTLSNGPIPDGMKVLHRCDNRPCVRPDHLFLGTQTDNMRDMSQKGRGRGGGTRFSVDKVLAIRAARAGGASLRDLVERFGISLSSASNLASGKTWSHLP